MTTSPRPRQQLDELGKEWRFPWPNAADFNFNYFRLLSDAEEKKGIASFESEKPRVAIVGAGAAGLAAARELVRCGAGCVHIYEATDRIGGRLWSERVPGQKRTTYELGAMRIPRFSDEDGAADGRSVFAYYEKEFRIECVAFPNPGSAAAKMTGIFLRDGGGPNGDLTSRMLAWDTRHVKPNESVPPPPTKELRDVFNRWEAFADLVKRTCRPVYEKGGVAWRELWRGIVRTYWDKDFAELVTLDPKPSGAEKGDFGGLGMSEEESKRFYVIGAGDGGWGAFFSVGSLYVIRTLLFGFGAGHRLVKGCADCDRTEVRAPRSNNGHLLDAPAFLGVQSLAECLFYRPIDGEASLYDRCQNANSGVRLFTRSPVRRLARVAEDDKKPIAKDDEIPITLEAEGVAPQQPYDAVILTCPTWALELGIQFDGFTAEHVPWDVRHSLNTSHWITSCKVFWPLEKWIEPEDVVEDPAGSYLTSIPPLIMTDTFLQGVYAYRVDEEPGALLISYTWEDDATKLAAIEDDQELAKRCLQKLAAILERCGIHNLYDHVDPTRIGSTRVIRWSRQPSYAGCSKLYRERMWNENYALLRYNQDHSRTAKLYFAGDAYSVESGWVESALRSALDAVIWVVRNHGATPNTEGVDAYPDRLPWREPSFD